MSPRTWLSDVFDAETAKIAWQELQRFFAQGLAIGVEPELDLVDVAYRYWYYISCQITHGTFPGTHIPRNKNTPCSSNMASTTLCPPHAEIIIAWGTSGPCDLDKWTL